MGYYKNQAIDFVEQVLKKLGKMDDNELWAQLSEELMSIGVKDFAEKYNIETGSNL